MSSAIESVEAEPRQTASNRAAEASRSTWRHLVGAVVERFTGFDIPRFELELPDGTLHVLGTTHAASDPGAALFRLRVRNHAGARALGSFDEARMADAFMNGDIDVEGDFLAAFDLRKCFSDRHPFWSLWRFIPPLLLGQVKADKILIPRHYDVGDDFYFSFLDRDIRLYSQALYKSDVEPLESAARNKLDYIAATCRLQPGSRVLDVGAGWGSFSSYAAQRGADVTMMTLAQKQFDHLSGIARSSSYPGRMEVVRESIYAYAPGKRFDAIVLLGVMEHLPDYFSLCRKFDRLLEPNGRVYMDFSAIRQKFKSSTTAYRHVFPGNHTPVVLHELLAAANASSFESVEVHNDRHSYFLTLAEWARRLEAARAQLVASYGQRTFRLFQLYLWATAHAMSVGTLESYRVVIQRALGSRSSEVGLAPG
jgi:cyclopropane-fatty-acyl-phospholipid synthase